MPHSLLRSTSFLLLIVCLLPFYACSYRPLEHWHNIAPISPGDISSLVLQEKTRAEVSFFGQKPKKARYHQGDSTIRFRIARDRYEYQYLFRSKDSAVLIRSDSASEKIMVLIPNARYLEQLSKGLGDRKAIHALIGALRASSVEARATNVIALFGEGDYVTTATILQLLGLPPTPRLGERDDFQQQRKIGLMIKRIYRKGNRFYIERYDPRPFDTSIPIYGKDQQQDGRFELDLTVGEDVYLEIKALKDGLKVDVSGVKVGKGFIKVGIPSLKVKGDYGSLLGLKFYLAR